MVHAHLSSQLGFSVFELLALNSWIGTVMQVRGGWSLCTQDPAHSQMKLGLKPHFLLAVTSGHWEVHLHLDSTPR